MDGTGSGSYLVAGFGISGVEPSGSATRELVSKMDIRETGCEAVRWLELVQNCVKWGGVGGGETLVSTVFEGRILHENKT